MRRQSNGFNSASIQYMDIATVVRAVNKMQDREKYNKNNFKVPLTPPFLVSIDSNFD